MTSVIVDDDLIDRDALSMYCQKISDLQVVKAFDHPISAYEFLQAENVDLVISDIDMPDMDGLALLNSLQVKPIFIFISSHPEHAAESYNLDVADFIVKPVTLPRLIKAIAKAKLALESKSQISQVNALTNSTKFEDHFYIKENYGHQRIEHAEVLYVESMGNFSTIYTANGKKHITMLSLKKFEELLPAAAFVRIHKQTIVAINKIAAITSNNTIELKNAVTLPLGNSYKPALMELVQKNLLNKN